MTTAFAVREYDHSVDFDNPTSQIVKMCASWAEAEDYVNQTRASSGYTIRQVETFNIDINLSARELGFVRRVAALRRRLARQHELTPPSMANSGNWRASGVTDKIASLQRRYNAFGFALIHAVDPTYPEDLGRLLYAIDRPTSRQYKLAKMT